MMTTPNPMPLDDRLRRTAWLTAAGLLVLAAGWTIACWGVAGLPLGLASLAAAALALLRPEAPAASPEDEARCPAAGLRHFTQAGLLTLVALQLAA
ncbi:hypothetical protein [Halomonas koreensis]|uniref:Uncharacterized protein n=1 Tax=Halomonas koreensis TaxID=245385 RepID=A0ABU1G1K9_9GAMM|nr:hypothetical protein [Halomonas koreensis]MDR5866805.1 hypothetical protein [Halomonas koreensis]